MITSALIASAGTWLGKKIADKGFDSIYKTVTSQKFKQNFRKCIDEVSTELQKTYPDALGGSIEYFFKDEDVLAELMKLLFIDSKVDKNIIAEKFDVETLPENFILEFIVLLRQKLHIDNNFKDILANKELYITVVGINENVEELAKISNLKLEELKKITFLLEEKSKQKFSLDNFLRRYKESLINNFHSIAFIGLELESQIKRKRKNLMNLFVKPSFEIKNIKSKKTFEYANVIDDNISLGALLEEYEIKDLPIPSGTISRVPKELQISVEDLKEVSFWLSNNLHKLFDLPNKKIVILGDPGSGKSILTKFITLSIIQNKEDTFSKKEIFDTTPFRIELRKYHAFKKEKKGGILKYMIHQLEHEYGIPEITISNLKSLLKRKTALFIFDGLDEIFLVKDKIDITNDIENFYDDYPDSWMLTTSRIIGYEDAPLNEEDTSILQIRKFNNTQIRNYVNNWYEQEEINEHQRKEEIEDFFEKLNLISDELKSNPLLLSLIVILYRNNLKLPESKLDIYKSCTKTLVNKWDANKELDINLEPKINDRKDVIFADLAFWQYKELSKEKVKITFQKAKNTVAKTIGNKLRLADEFTQDNKAESFLEYAEKRSLYFDNNFTHKTFLEYYTAFWIFSNIEKKHKTDERNQLIAKYINNSFWHIVIELLLNMIDKDQADTEMIDELVEYQLDKSINSIQLFLDILPSIQNISEEVIKKIFLHTIEYLIKSKNVENKEKKDEDLHTTDFINFMKFAENKYYQDILLISFEEYYGDKIEDNEKSLFFHLLLEITEPITDKSKIEEFLMQTDIEEYIQKEQSLFLQYFKLKLKEGIDIDVNCIKDFIQKFDAEKLFNAPLYIFMKIRTSVSFLDFIFYLIFSSDTNKEQFKLLFDILKDHEISSNTIYSYIINDSRLPYMIRNNQYQKLIDLINYDMFIEVNIVLTLIFWRTISNLITRDSKENLLNIHQNSLLEYIFKQANVNDKEDSYIRILEIKNKNQLKSLKKIIEEYNLDENLLVEYEKKSNELPF